MNKAKEYLAEMFLEGVRVSGRPLTLASIRAAFEAGFDAGEKGAIERCAEIARPVDESLATVLLGETKRRRKS